MNISVLPSSEILQATASVLNELFSKEREKEFLFLSSGGSCLALLEHIDPSNFDSRCTISVLDERYSRNPLRNTFAQIQKTHFYKKATEYGAHSIDTRPQKNESMLELSQRFERELRAWRTRSSGSIIATVGIGIDAHTAGIVPFPEDPSFFEDTFNSLHWVASYDAGAKAEEPLRITTTIPFFKTITHSVIFVTGEAKKNALAKLYSDTGSLAESPCRVWRDIPEVKVFTDVN